MTLRLTAAQGMIRHIAAQRIATGEPFIAGC
jgi:TPP-dependent trihydroxycyclohexane-1,2-dione (THcHDO) dehydratase